MKIVKTKSFEKDDFFTLISSVCGQGECASQDWVYSGSQSEYKMIEVEKDNGEVEREKKYITKVFSSKTGVDPDQSLDYCVKLTFETGGEEVAYKFNLPELEEIFREKEVIESSYDMDNIHMTCKDSKYHIVTRKSKKVKTLFRDVKKIRASYRQVAGIAALLVILFSPIALVLL